MLLCIILFAIKILRVILGRNRYLDLGNGSTKFGNHCPTAWWSNRNEKQIPQLQFSANKCGNI